MLTIQIFFYYGELAQKKTLDFDSKKYVVISIDIFLLLLTIFVSIKLSKYSFISFFSVNFVNKILFSVRWEDIENEYLKQEIFYIGLFKGFVTLLIIESFPAWYQKFVIIIQESIIIYAGIHNNVHQYYTAFAFSMLIIIQTFYARESEKYRRVIFYNQYIQSINLKDYRYIFENVLPLPLLVLKKKAESYVVIKSNKAAKE